MKTHRLYFLMLVLLCILPGTAWADFGSDLKATGAELSKVMGADQIAPKNRSRAIATATALVDKYPQQAAAHRLLGLVLMAARQGDQAIKAADAACKLDRKMCASGNGWVTQIEESFSWCIDFLTRENDCDLMANSSEVLTIRMQDKYLTNRGDHQVFIGKMTKFSGRDITLEITWARKGFGVTKGQEATYPIEKVMKLREAAPEAEKAGWR